MQNSISAQDIHFSLTLLQNKLYTNFIQINRGYYMAARGYEFYLRVLKVSLMSEGSERVRDTFST